MGSENSHNGIAVDQMSQQQQHHKPKFLQELGSPGLDVTGLMSKETEGGLTESDPRYRLRIIGKKTLKFSEKNIKKIQVWIDLGMETT